MRANLSLAYIHSFFGLSLTSFEPRWLQRGSSQYFAENSNIGKKKTPVHIFWLKYLLPHYRGILYASIETTSTDAKYFTEMPVWCVDMKKRVKKWHHTTPPC